MSPGRYYLEIYKPCQIFPQGFNKLNLLVNIAKPSPIVAQAGEQKAVLEFLGSCLHNKVLTRMSMAFSTTCIQTAERRTDGKSKCRHIQQQQH